MSKNKELCIKNNEFCSQNDELCISNEEICISNDESCSAMDTDRAGWVGSFELQQGLEQVSFQWKNPDFLF